MKKSVALNLRVSVELAEALARRAEEEKTERSQVIRAALEAYLLPKDLSDRARLDAVERALEDIQRRLDDRPTST